MRLFGKVGGTLRQLRAALLTIPFDMVFGSPTVPTAMAAELRIRPRFDATVSATPPYTATTQTSPRETATVGVNY